MVNDIKSLLRFGFEVDVLGNTGSFATMTVVDLFLDQIQPAADELSASNPTIFVMYHRQSQWLEL